MKKMVFLLFVLGSTLWAEEATGRIVPLGLGVSYSMAEKQQHPFLDEELVKPFAQIVILNYGMLRVGYSRYAYESEFEDITEEKTVRTLSLELFVNLNPAWENPYFTVGWNFKKVLDNSESGDRDWKEWMVGLGGKWPVSPGLELFAQAEMQWADEELEYQGRTWNSYQRMAMSLGFCAFFY